MGQLERERQEGNGGRVAGMAVHHQRPLPHPHRLQLGRQLPHLRHPVKRKLLPHPVFKNWNELLHL